MASRVSPPPPIQRAYYNSSIIPTYQHFRFSPPRSFSADYDPDEFDREVDKAFQRHVEQGGTVTIGPPGSYLPDEEDEHERVIPDRRSHHSTTGSQERGTETTSQATRLAAHESQSAAVRLNNGLGTPAHNAQRPSLANGSALDRRGRINPDRLTYPRDDDTEVENTEPTEPYTEPFHDEGGNMDLDPPLSENGTITLRQALTLPDSFLQSTQQSNKRDTQSQQATDTTAAGDVDEVSQEDEEATQLGIVERRFERVFGSHRPDSDSCDDFDGQIACTGSDFENDLGKESVR